MKNIIVPRLIVLGLAIIVILLAICTAKCSAQNIRVEKFGIGISWEKITDNIGKVTADIHLNKDNSIVASFNQICYNEDREFVKEVMEVRYEHWKEEYFKLHPYESIRLDTVPQMIMYTDTALQEKLFDIWSECLDRQINHNENIDCHCKANFFVRSTFWVHGFMVEARSEYECKGWFIKNVKWSLHPEYLQYLNIHKKPFPGHFRVYYGVSIECYSNEIKNKTQLKEL